MASIRMCWNRVTDADFRFVETVQEPNAFDRSRNAIVNGTPSKILGRVRFVEFTYDIKCRYAHMKIDNR